MCSSVILNAFTLCATMSIIHPRITYLIFKTETQYPLNNKSSFPYFQPLVSTTLFSVSDFYCSA